MTKLGLSFRFAARKWCYVNLKVVAEQCFNSRREYIFSPTKSHFLKSLYQFYIEARKSLGFVFEGAFVVEVQIHPLTHAEREARARYILHYATFGRPVLVIHIAVIHFSTDLTIEEVLADASTKHSTGDVIGFQIIRSDANARIDRG